jgi:hypothetical protein
VQSKKEDAMLSRHFRTPKSKVTFFLWGTMLTALLPAQAQFVPVQKTRVLHWKEADSYGFMDYHWLNDKEIVFIQYAPLPSRYVKRNMVTGTEQVLVALTKCVRESNHNVNDLSYLFPSANGKHVAWQPTNDRKSIVMATIDGSVTDYNVYQSYPYCPSWSEDSKYFICLLTRKVHMPGDDPGPGSNNELFSSISSMSTTKPAAIKTSLIPKRSQLAKISKLPYIPYVHVKTSNNITLLLPDEDTLQRGAVLAEEFNLRNTTGAVSTYSVKLPASRSANSAVISPDGKMIAWKLRYQKAENVAAETEIWISAGPGRPMVQLGKLTHPLHGGWPDSYDRSEIAWLPSGKAISFREAGELYVVYLDTDQSSN